MQIPLQRGSRLTPYNHAFLNSLYLVVLLALLAYMHYVVLHQAVCAPRAGLWTAGIIIKRKGKGRKDDQLLFLAMENLAYFTVYLERKIHTNPAGNLISSWIRVDFSFPSHCLTCYNQHLQHWSTGPSSALRTHY